jgi:hypothetical protein
MTDFGINGHDYSSFFDGNGALNSFQALGPNDGNYSNSGADMASGFSGGGISGYNPAGNLTMADVQALQSATSQAANQISAGAQQVSDFSKQIAGMNINTLQQTGLAASAVLAPFSAVGYSAGNQITNLMGAGGAQAQQEAIQSLGTGLQSAIQPIQQQALQTGNISALTSINQIYGGSLFSNNPQEMEQQDQQAQQQAIQQAQQHAQQVNAGLVQQEQAPFANPYAAQLTAAQQAQSAFTTNSQAQIAAYQQAVQSTNGQEGNTLQKEQFINQTVIPALQQYGTLPTGIAQQAQTLGISGGQVGSISAAQQTEDQLSQQFNNLKNPTNSPAANTQGPLSAADLNAFGLGNTPGNAAAIASLNPYTSQVNTLQTQYNNAQQANQASLQQQQQANQAALQQQLTGINGQYNSSITSAQQLAAQQAATPTALDNARSAFGNYVNQDPTQFANTAVNNLVSPANNAVNNYLNNTFLNPSLNAMTTQGTNAIMSNAGASGMLGSGKVLQDIYNNGQSIAGQYVIPGIQSISNNVLQGGLQADTSVANAIGSQAGGMLNNAANASAYVGSQTSLGLSGQSTNTLNNQLSSNQTVGAQMFGQGNTSAIANAGIQQSGGVNQAAQNTWMGDQTNNATLASANAQANATLSNAQLQYLAAQMGVPGSSSSNGSTLGILGGGIASEMGLAFLGGI